jgi:hypothetical protein
MIKKLRNQPYAPKWKQEEEKKVVTDELGRISNNGSQPGWPVLLWGRGA